MIPYTGPPVCQGCNAPLSHDGGVCFCGGRSQYVDTRWYQPEEPRVDVAAAMAAAERRWETLMSELRKFYGAER